MKYRSYRLGYAQATKGLRSPEGLNSRTGALAHHGFSLLRGVVIAVVRAIIVLIRVSSSTHDDCMMITVIGMLALWTF